MEEDLDRRIEAKLSGHKDDILREIGNMFKLSTATNSCELNKLTRMINSDMPKFKRKSNEEQFKLNSKVLVKLEGVEHAQDVTECRAMVKEAHELLTHRQKLIMLADASELGWRVVHEYETNPLAEDSEDERRIFKAEARAARKVKVERGKKPRPRFAPYSRGNGRAAATPRSTYSAQTATSSTKPGLCFACGKPGHWKNECPEAVPNNKMSINFEQSFCQGSLQMSVTKGLGKDSEQNSIVLDNPNTCIHIEASPVSPVGRLKNHLSKWKQVTSDLYILDVVQNGYKLPFITTPVSTLIRNNQSARANPDFVAEEIDRLLAKGVVQEVKDVPYVVNPLTVAFSKSGKPRLVLDCRHINPHLHLFNVKFEDVKTAESLFHPGSYVFTYDLKSAYHHIDIFEGHRSFLGFSWDLEGEPKYYVFCSLPFGLSTAGHIFTKTLKVVVAFLRSKGHKVIMFLDDGIGGDKEYSNALRSSQFVQLSILEFVFLLAQEKCNWEPRRTAEWLGYVLNFDINKFFIKEDRIDRIEQSLEKVLSMVTKGKYPLVNARVLASVIGQIISMQFVLGNKVRMLTRHMYNCVMARASWNSPVLVTDVAMNEMRFWKQNARSLNNKGRGLLEITACQYFVFCDASAIGYGGFLQSQEACSLGTDHLSTFPTSEFVKTSECVNSNVSNDSVLPEVRTGLKGIDYVDKGMFSDSVLCERRLERGGDAFPYIDKGLPIGKERLPEVSTGCSKRKAIRNDCSIVTGTNTCNPLCSKVGGGYQPLESGGLLPEVSKGSGNELQGNIQYKVLKDSEVVGSWSGYEASKSSTWRETEAVRRVIQSNIDILKKKRIKVFSDNKNTTSIILNGNRCADIHAVASDIAILCDDNKISMLTEWIPRIENKDADLLSRCDDSDDWSISDSWFAFFDSIWGKHTVDRFASSYNKHCNKFNSRWWVPGTDCVDAFCKCWTSELNWLVPPPSLIVKCIRKMETEHAKGTLVVPYWPSAAFWSCIVNADNRFKAFIVDYRTLPRHGVVCVGKGNNGVFSKDPLPFNMLALKVNF